MKTIPTDLRPAIDAAMPVHVVATSGVMYCMVS